MFYFDDRTRDVLCAGYIGGKSGLKQQFCCKQIEGGVGNSRMFCSQCHKGEKFPLTPKTYYIPMKSESALVSPYVTAAELEEAKSVHLVKGLHSSREWIDIISKFNASRGIRSVANDVSPYGFMDSDGDVPHVEMGEDEYHDASADLVSSALKGARALQMLSSSRLESLRALLPVVNLFGTVKEEVLADEEIQDAEAPYLAWSPPSIRCCS